MRILFIGTSHGRPEPNRRCSSALIEIGERRYFVDMGTQSVEELINRGIPPQSVQGVFITHMHGDHTDGLLSLLRLCSGAYRGADPVICLPGDTERTKAAITEWLACNHETLAPMEFRHVEAGTVFDDGTLRVVAYRTGHIDFSYGFLLEGEGRRVYFSGDMSHRGPAADFPQEVLAAPLDLAVCESAHFAATEYVTALGGQENLKRLYFHHYSSRFLASVLEAKEALAPTCEVVIATDGTEITL